MSERGDRGAAVQFAATAMWFAGMGWTIAIAILLGVLAGNWLDGHFHTHPLFLLIGLVLGLGLGLYSAGRMLMRFLSMSSGTRT